MTSPNQVPGRPVRLQAFLPAVLALALAACTPATSPSPTSLQPVAAFEIDGTWERCHQLGTCVYRLELSGPDGFRSSELRAVTADGVSGRFAPGPGFPTRLVPGPHKLTLVSTMLGDTLEPNGEQTVLGEEARCATEFVVDPTATLFVATFAFVPRGCTVTLRSAGVGQ